jgi:hypothetical protein
MGYNLINWENSPSKQTPINAENLNQMDENIAKAIQGTRFNFSATFTADNVLKNTRQTDALGAGSFATSQTDIVTVFVADNVTKINNGAFSGCTSLKTIYIDNTVGNVDIVSGSVPSGVSIVYSNDDNFINVNELLASAIKSLKKQADADKSDWENRATSIEAQHKTDVQALTDKANSIVEQANTDRQNFNNSVDEINTKLETKENVSNKVSVITHPSLDYYPDTKAVFDYVNSKLETPLSDIEILKADFNSYKTSNDNAVNSKVDTTDFNTYKTATDKAIADNTKSIKANTTAIDKCVTDIAINSALINQNSIKATTDKSTSIVLNDSSDCNIVGLTLYGKSTQSAIPTPTNPVAIKDINNPKITVTNDSDSQSINIQCTLRGIGNVCDTLTVNSDGTGYITQRLFVERITSQQKSTSYEWNYSKTTHRFFRNDYSYSFDVKDNKPLILCSHLDVGENEKNTDFDNSIGWINVSGVGIAIRMTEFDGDIAKFKKWLDDNEVYVVAPRSKPITVNLSKDEVDKILSLHTYYPSTKISADADFEATYIADTKNYIDNKILEVATALVASESEVM